MVFEKINFKKFELFVLFKIEKKNFRNIRTIWESNYFEFYGIFFCL